MKGHLSHEPTGVGELTPSLSPNCFIHSDVSHGAIVTGALKFWFCNKPLPSGRYAILWNANSKSFQAHEVQVYGALENNNDQDDRQRLNFINAETNNLDSSLKFSSSHNLLPIKVIDHHIRPFQLKPFISCASAKEFRYPPRITLILNSTFAVEEVIIMPCYDAITGMCNQKKYFEKLINMILYFRCRKP